MGFSGISVWQLLIILVIVLLIFGTKRLKNIGADLGGAIKGFKGSMKESETDQKKEQPEQLEQADKETVETADVKGSEKERV